MEAGALAEGLGCREHVADQREQLVSGAVQGQALVRAVEQLDAEVLLELPELAGEAGLGDVEPLGGAADGPGLDRCEQVAQLP